MHVGLITRGEIAYALDIANDLSEFGIDATLYLSHKHVAQILDTPDRPLKRLYELRLLPPTCKVRLLHLPRMRDPRSFIVIQRLSKDIRDDGVDIAHIIFDPGEIWFALLAVLLRMQKMPVTSSMIVPKPNKGEEVPIPIVWMAHKLLALGSDMVIVNGENQVALVQKLFRVPLEQIAYIPLGLGFTAPRWSTTQTDEEPRTILFFGRAHPHKGLEYLIQAQPLVTEKIPDLRILISAHGKEMRRIQALIQDRSKFEIHEGIVPGTEAARFFERCCLVVLPYITASTSGVLMQALSFGKPVVATRVGCLPEYVIDGVTGLLVPPRDVSQLADAIALLLSDDGLRKRMGENAKRWVQEKKKEVARQLTGVYIKAVSMRTKK